MRWWCPSTATAKASRRNLSPLIVAFIFITFIQNTLGRHRIRHFRERFKRQQGENLYLAGSYVAEGGVAPDAPDSGPWTEWSAPSSCSRSCGGGVSTQRRSCQQGYTCYGPELRHVTCNTQDCPDAADFRAQQCSEYNNNPFEGVLYEWVPYTKSHNPCELNCMPRGQRFYYRHATQVIDGTRCNDDSYDVCVNGKCQPVGCDRMLGSSAKEDECRICGGDGSTCNTVTHVMNLENMQVGYNDILLIPAGATNIKVEEVEDSDNYLAVRNTTNHYYLNGNWRIDFPRTIEFAGCKWTYQREPQGFAAPDMLSCLGPTEEPLYIVLLYQASDVPIRYKYSLPTNIQPGSESETYAWTFDQFTTCSTTCGGGIQYRNVTCAGRKTLEPVDRSLCDAKLEPEASRKCNEVACDANWVPRPWSKCSAPCGQGGTQTRQVDCQQIVSNGYPILADEAECLSRGPKPHTEQECNKGRTCAEWHTGPWKPCDHLCDEGKQSRKVHCYIKDENGKIKILDDAECETLEPKPEEERTCNIRPCEGVDWITSGWSGCERICGLTTETRKVFCATQEGQIYSDDLCEEDKKPEIVRKCESTNASCEYLWYASQWSECSALCGEGVQTRTVFCGVVTPDGVKKVENDKCDAKQFNTEQKCVGTEQCDGEWFSGPFGECSKTCGDGIRKRKVVCIKENKVVEASHCNVDTILYAEEKCSSEPCSEDSIIPTDVSKSVDESEPTKKETETTEILTTTEEITTSTVGDTTTEESSSSTEGSSSVSEMISTTEGSSTSGTDLTGDFSEIMKSFEITTEKETTTKETPEDDEEYEVVAADTCDDGEWVYVGEVKGTTELKETDLSASPIILETSTEPIAESSIFSLDDVMLSDGTTLGDEELKSSLHWSTISGSGDGETSPVGTESSIPTEFSKSTDDEEGSGSTIITEMFSPETSYSTGLGSSSSQVSESGATTVSGLSEGSTVSGASAGSTVSGASEGSTISGASEGTTVSGASVGSTVSGATEVSTVSGISEGSTVSSASEGSTVSGASQGSSVSGSSEGSTVSGVSGGAETTTQIGTTVSGSTDISSTSESSTESSISTETTESTETTMSTESTQSTETTASMETVETTSSEYSPSTETVSTDSASESTGSDTSESTAKSDATTVESSVSSLATESSVSGATESAILSSSAKSSESTTIIGSSGTTESPGITQSLASTESSGSTDASVSTGTPGSTEAKSSTESGSTQSVGSTELPGSSGSTETITEISSLSTLAGSSSTGTTEVSGSTVSTIEFTGSTEFTTESMGSTESTTEFTGSTESTTEFTGSTESTGTEETATDLYSTTPITDIFKKGPRLCKRRKIMVCKRSKYGCCWDHITAAKGPFDEGCPIPKTCKESKFGCCEDGVSAALGPKNAGCPASPCNETLFGCCPDKKTPAEGNDNEGCPPPPPACLKSKWGCCKDNVTEAQGANGKGCEPEPTEEPEETTEKPEEDCKSSKFGCCPDDKMSAQGPNFRGCETPCSNTQFGCCPDGSTPAHGPAGEGCCLSSPFGCCPDDTTPARGVNFEGCGCQYSPYGCCPDNKTSARGHNNQGCGCKYLQHGCCPDDYTPAHGPNSEGCLCHTFQFGCCPDGVSIAQGPHQQGCGCRNSEFGCCSDEETPARGPNRAGCGCESTKYGCCLDGVTEAQGENFEGCSEIPVNLQESCSLSKDRGSCRNYTVKWFYDMEYGGCSRFWYGGCEGNNNRFKTKEDCDDVCTHPSGPEKCNLPKVSGPCAGYYINWYYNREQRQCMQFAYGGCLGNENRFETRDECTQLCVKDTSVDGCEQPKEEGPCHGNYTRYYFDKDTEQCREFTYGGCKGNNNNFQTSEACNQKCSTPGRKKDHCSLPRAQGNCTEKVPRWYYDTPEKRCLPFYYSGCNGNQNNFDTKDACEVDCPLEIVKDTCHLAADIGDCGNYVTRWYYDTRERHCRQFYYGGCGGNGNNFETEEQCQGRCTQPQPTPEPEQPARPSQPEQPQPQPQPQAFQREMCFLPEDPGRCGENSTRYFYDRYYGICRSFTYTGCEGNRNNFGTMQECLHYCETAQDLCSLPPLVGNCDGEYRRFYYDQRTDSCYPFNYGGCDGNNNRFDDQASCEQRCRRAPPPTITEAPRVPGEEMCYEPVDSGNCNDSYTAYFYDAQNRTCTSFTYSGCGGNRNRFSSEEQCERQCGAFRGQDVCNIERDPGPCSKYFIKYYFDKERNQCGRFVYGGCYGNGNRFSTQEDCEQVCITHEEVKPVLTSTEACQLPAEQGSCGENSHTRWYFDRTRKDCVVFSYTGCGGNFNNFKSYNACIDYCRHLLPQVEPPSPGVPGVPPHECQEVFDQCTTLRCPYGVEAFVDENNCNRCTCQNPCRNIICQEETKCVIDLNRNKTTPSDPDFVALCREINKRGECPTIESGGNCETECETDADCTLNLKCCSTSCGTACVEPARGAPAEYITPPAYLPGYTIPPSLLEYAPRIDTQVFEPNVSGLLGDQVILNCAISGNPNPKITWRKDNLLIDGTQPRYRIKLDQTLHIITLHKTDSGIYLCTADNKIGPPITNEIKLEVTDSPERSATIIDPGDEPYSEHIVSLNAPAKINCYALGFPLPQITWWKENKMVPLNNEEFEVREDFSLLIHKVQLKNLGIYTCQAYNGVGKASSWQVTIRAKGPFHTDYPAEQVYLQYLINPEVPEGVPPKPTQPPYIPPVYHHTEPSPEIDANEILPEEPPAAGYRPEPEYLVPLRVNITTNERKYPTGGEIVLPCEVTGYPTPQVQWYKDGVQLNSTNRILISENNTLVIRQAENADSGAYQCVASNTYSQKSSTIDILVQGIYIDPNCVDNKFLAKCELIVKANLCSHPYYAKFCCRSCAEAKARQGASSPFVHYSEQEAIANNLVK